MKKAILSTLSFFDIFDRPLTFDELYLYLYEKKATKESFQANLSELVHKGKVAKLGEWYFLPGRLKFLGEYHEHQKQSEKLLKKAQKYCWKLKNIPFIKMAAVTNSIAFKSANSKSDIDLFIITRKNRLYTARTFLILYYKTLRVYQKRGQDRAGHFDMLSFESEPEGSSLRVEDRAGKIGAGFFVDEKALDIDSIRLKDNPDPYLDFWLATMMPLYGEKSYKQFIEDNSWFSEKFPNFTFDLKLKTDGWYFPAVEKKSSFARFFEWLLGGFLGDIKEFFLRRYHIKHTWSLPENYRITSTTITKRHIIKLHAKDRRAEFAKKFEEKMREVGG